MRNIISTNNWAQWDWVLPLCDIFFHPLP